MISPESPHQHPHTQTGRRWLDLLVAFSALAISLVSIIVAVHHGRTMEKLVEADTWPYVRVDSSNVGPEGERQVAITLRNAGAGPVKVKTFALLYQGRAYRDWPSLIRACCAPAGLDLGSQEALYAAVGNDLVTGNTREIVMIPGDVQTVLRLGLQGANEALWKQFDRVRQRFTYRICYCSVFDDCFQSNLTSTDTVRVAACPAEPTPWQ